MDPFYKKIADKEINSIQKAIMKNLKDGVMELGPRKFCKDIIRDNIKDFKSVIKVTERLESPSKKLKDLINKK